MASGLPVITFDDPAYAPYELDREFVALVDVDASASEGVGPARGTWIVRRRMGEYFRVAYARDRFAWERHAEQLLEVYRDASGSRG